MLHAARPMRISAQNILALAALVVAAMAFAPPTSLSQTAALEDFHGQWTFSGSQRDLQSLENGIDHVVEQLNLFIREIARGEMRRRITPENRVRFGVESETRVSLGVDEWGPVGFELGEAPRTVRGPNGDDIRIGLSFRRGQLVHREIHGQGHRTNVFSLNGDGTRLTMGATIGSNQLPDTIRYRLTYRRLR